MKQITQDKIRNLAIIAHVDHGKTTLVDGMLKQSGIFHEKQVVEERVLDSGELERERGITIMAKNTAIFYNGYKLNIVDTPGHADFGGEVERIVQMVDGVLLLVDAFEGPMPQTRFVLKKALDAELVPIVVINKIDRPHARPEEVLDEILELFIELDASDQQLEFPVVYTDARKGIAFLNQKAFIEDSGKSGSQAGGQTRGESKTKASCETGGQASVHANCETGEPNGNGQASGQVRSSSAQVSCEDRGKTTAHASASSQAKEASLKPLFDLIIKNIPAPKGDPNAPLQLGVSMIDYDPYLGRQAVGRIQQGCIHNKQDVAVLGSGEQIQHSRLSNLYVFDGLKKVPVENACAGEIVVAAGLDDINAGCTIADPEHPESLRFVHIDEPTVSIAFLVNKSPFAGREGTYVTSRKLGERLFREAESDVSLRIKETDSPDQFLVAGRGELHLSILIEKMRREGYEFEVSQPQVIQREIDGVKHEPVEDLIVEVPEEYVGIVMERLGSRRSEMINMQKKKDGTVRLEFYVPTRGLFGFRAELMTETRGTAVMNHSFHHYSPYCGEIHGRSRGSLVAWENGMTTAFGLENAQERGEMFVGAGVSVYQGMVVGENSRPSDLAINVCKKKRLTNMRSSTADIAVKLTPPREMSLEQCLEFIAADELLEITPKSLRMRKK
ncbi:MAG: GTP-binding protein TypA/BipA [Syntrophaceticus schinkii]|jgi:GTP-binding protein|nr:GTP-binding protein [Syntrophaceticus schinkii]